MSSNLSTSRLLARMPPDITFIEIADDIYVCDPVHKARIITAMGAHPQVQFLIKQDLRADEVVFNNHGDRGWVLRQATQPIASAMKSVTMGTVYKSSIMEVGPRPQVVIAGGQSKMTILNKSANFNGGTSTYQQLTTISDATFGPYQVGVTQPVELERSTNQQGVSQEVLRERLRPGSGYSISPNPDFVTVVPGMASFNGANYPGTITPSLRTGLLVVAGPAACDYAEFFPGFEWIVASYGKVADRLNALITHMKAKDKSIDITGFEKARDEMKAKSNASLLLFRGSESFDPVALWPFGKAASVASLTGAPVDGEVVTVETKAKGVDAWKSNRWCLTALDGGFSNKALRDTVSHISSAKVTIRPSASDAAHVSDGEGTISVQFGSALVDLIYAYRRSGTAVILETSSHEDGDFFQKAKWEEAKAATLVSPIPDVEPTTNVDDYSSLGESMCIRLLTAAQFTDDEELMVIPAMAPQYFWSKYAREAVKV